MLRPTQQMLFGARPLLLRTLVHQDPIKRNAHSFARGVQMQRMSVRYMSVSSRGDESNGGRTQPHRFATLSSNKTHRTEAGEKVRQTGRKGPRSEGLVKNPFPTFDSDQMKVFKAAMNRFSGDQGTKRALREHGLDDQLFKETLVSMIRSVQKAPKVDKGVLRSVLAVVNNWSGSSRTEPKLRDKHRRRFLQYLMAYFKQYDPKRYEEVQHFKLISDLTNPQNAYPAARQEVRTIICHLGPTNSGKTYRALEAFRKADRGIYCGPLRLLAREVSENISDKGVPCDTLTGEEVVYVNGPEIPADHTACTVEMTPIGQEYDVAVIDEIQMIADPDRGWAWTRALLGVQAKEVHVCGEPRAQKIIEKLAEMAGDVVQVQTYDRLTGLTVMDNSINADPKKLLPGDAVICFGRKSIYQFKDKIEKETDYKCAVVYGKLPSETRASQAKGFNSQDGTYDIVVATNAIGMGLNLNIRRVVFSTMEKFDGVEQTVLSVSDTKQIAGRAGRFGTAYPDGKVTTFRSKDLKTLRYLMGRDPEPIFRAGIQPTYEQVLMGHEALPNESLARILERMEAAAQVSGDFFLCEMNSQKLIANMIQPFDMELRERYTLCLAPMDTDCGVASAQMIEIAKCVSKSTKVKISQALYEKISPPKNLNELNNLEITYKIMDTYLWLSVRMPEYFPDVRRAKLIQDKVTRYLDYGIRSRGATAKEKREMMRILADTVNKPVNEEEARKHIHPSQRSRRHVKPEEEKGVPEETESEGEPRGRMFNAKASKDFYNAFREIKMNRKEADERILMFEKDETASPEIQDTETEGSGVVN
eukprot:Clim_evm102s172 gene=Clim_evmTU102s172